MKKSSFKIKNASPSYIGYDEKWEDRDDSELEENKKILKHNMEIDKKNSKTGWTNPKTGDKFSPEHFQENYRTEVKALQRVKDEQKRRKLVKNLKNTAVDKTGYKMRKRDKVDEELES